tara:strand:- start:48 stop:434 length:387 start_codon:yes stop_codon:yes gene_type:complete
MFNDMEIFKKNKKKYLKSIYNIPENYFNELNPKLENRINSLESKKSKIILFNKLFKAAAMFLLLIGFYFIFNYSSNIENINYVQLDESIDEYLDIENEIFYTFINDEDFNHLNFDENIDDYLEIEIDL